MNRIIELTALLTLAATGYTPGRDMDAMRAELRGLLEAGEAVRLADGTELRPLAPEPPSVVLGRAARVLCPAIRLARDGSEDCADAMRGLRE